MTIFDTRISDLSVNGLNYEHVMLKHREVSTPRNRVNILKLRAVSESKRMIYYYMPKNRTHSPRLERE